MRQSRRIGAKTSTIAFVVEGKTEMWYLQMLKKNEEREQKVRINIKPEIPQKKTLKDQYELVCELAAENKIVCWILDFDVILKETRECRKRQESPLADFLKYREKLLEEHDNVRNLLNCGLWLHCTGVSHTPRMKNSTLMTLIEQINADFYPSSLLACPDAYREGVCGYLFVTNICAVQTENT